MACGCPGASGAMVGGPGGRILSTAIVQYVQVSYLPYACALCYKYVGT